MFSQARALVNLFFAGSFYLEIYFKAVLGSGVLKGCDCCQRFRLVSASIKEV